MSNIICPKCSHENGSGAERCGSCGALLKDQDSYLQSCIMFVLVLFGLILLAIGGCIAVVSFGPINGSFIHPFFLIGIAMASGGAIMIWIAARNRSKK